MITLTNRQWSVIRDAVTAHISMSEDTIDIASVSSVLHKVEQRGSMVFLTINPHMVSGAVCINGSRMPIDTAVKIVANLSYRSGQWTDDFVFDYLQRNWPEYTRTAVLLCCWYAARHGRKKYRRAWKDWLESGEWDKPDGKLPPPIMEKGE